MPDTANGSAVPVSRRRLMPASLGLVIVLGVALLVRLALTFRAPLFVTGDSEGYLMPAFALAHGGELDLSLKRTPAYPAFVAFSLWLQGDGLQSLALLQHLVGLMTVGAAFWLGRTLAGTGAGITAALLVGLSGTQLIAEHSLMTEALFIPTLTLAMGAAVVAARGGDARWSLAAGALLGLAALVRPVALVLAPIVALGPLVQLGMQRRALIAAGLSLVGVLVVYGIWTLRPGRTDDAAVGGLGQTLIGRTARHDRGGFTYWDPSLHGTESAQRQQVRKILQEAVDRGSSGRAVHTRIRKETGLAPADADALMRDLALDTIRDQWSYYLQGTWLRFTRLSQPVTERLRDARNTNDTARQRWEDEPTRPLLAQVNTTYDREAASAEWMTSLVQFGRLGAVFPALALLGTVLLALQRQPGPAFILAASSVTLLLVSAALVGNVPRYRYPIDPLLCVLAISGLALGAKLLRSVVDRRTQARPSATLEATS